MKILYAGKHRLRIRLSGAEMDRLSIDSDGRVNCSDPDTRSALLSLLEESRRESKFAPGRERVMVEACPDGEGGGFLTFTLPPEEIAGQGMAPVVFHFDNAETLIAGAVRLYHQYRYRIHKSALYGWKEGYRLVLSPLDYTDRLSVYFLSEYAQKVGEGRFLAAFVEEHGHPIAEEEAIEMLAFYFSEPV